MNKDEQDLLNFLTRYIRVDNYILAKYFPLHLEHYFNVINKKYYGVLLLEKIFKCSCGQKLKVSRDMMDDANLAIPCECSTCEYINKNKV